MHHRLDGSTASFFLFFFLFFWLLLIWLFVAVLLFSVLSSCRLPSFVSFFLSSLFCFYFIAKSLDGSSASFCCCCCCLLLFSVLPFCRLPVYVSFFCLYHHALSSSFVLPQQFSLHSNATVYTSVSVSTCYHGHVFLMGMGFGRLSQSWCV